jgi:hypothetical protein
MLIPDAAFPHRVGRRRALLCCDIPSMVVTGNCVPESGVLVPDTQLVDRKLAGGRYYGYAR